MKLLIAILIFFDLTTFSQSNFSGIFCSKPCCCCYSSCITFEKDGKFQYKDNPGDFLRRRGQGNYRVLRNDKIELIFIDSSRILHGFHETVIENNNKLDSIEIKFFLADQLTKSELAFANIVAYDSLKQVNVAASDLNGFAKMTFAKQSKSFRILIVTPLTKKYEMRISVNNSAMVKVSVASIPKIIENETKWIVKLNLHNSKLIISKKDIMTEKDEILYRQITD